MIQMSSTLSRLIELKQVKDFMMKRRPNTFEVSLDRDLKGIPSTEAVERAKNFFMAGERNISEVRAHVVSDTNKRIADLKHEDSLELETYLDNMAVSWRCRIPYAIFGWFAKRCLYTRFAFKRAPSFAKFLCCFWIIFPRCCCGRASHRMKNRRKLAMQRRMRRQATDFYINRVRTTDADMSEILVSEKKEDD